MRSLISPRLLLREWEEKDVDFLLDMYSRWEVARYLGSSPRALTGHDDAVSAALSAVADVRLDRGGRPSFTLTHAGRTVEVALRVVGGGPLALAGPSGGRRLARRAGGQCATPA